MSGFLMVGGGGSGYTAMISTDEGATFNDAAPPGDYNTRVGVATNNVIAVAVDNGGNSYVTSSGVDWVQYATSFTARTHSLTYNGSFFCVITTAGDSATSTDGQTWTVHTVGGLGGPMVWNGSVFCCGSTTTSTVYTSTNGVSWTSHALAQYATLLGILGTKLCVIDNQFASGTRGYASVSTDNGASWSTPTLMSGTVNDWGAISYLGAYFVAVALGNYSARSTDGVTWTLSSLNTNISSNFGAIASDNTYVVVGGGSGGVTTRTLDGLNWTLCSAPHRDYWFSMIPFTALPPPIFWKDFVGTNEVDSY